MNAELLYAFDAPTAARTFEKSQPMTVTVNRLPSGAYEIVCSPDSIIFKAKDGPRLLLCTLKAGTGAVPADIWFEDANYVPMKFLQCVDGIGQKNMTLTFAFSDTKVRGHLWFRIGGLLGDMPPHDPQVGNDPPPGTSPRERPC